MLYSRTTSPSPSTRVYVYLMRVHVVSDVHGTADALATAGDGADMLICLGDMLLFLDYADHTQGIFAELYGAEHAREYIALRTARRFDEARQLTAGIAARLTADRGTDLRTLTERGDQQAVRGAVRRAGRARLPHLRQRGRAADVERLPASPATRCSTAAARWSAASRSASSARGLISPYRTPNEIPEAEFAAKLDAVGAVDVLCTHIPPAVPELLYDTEARRMETGQRRAARQ